MADERRVRNNNDDQAWGRDPAPRGATRPTMGRQMSEEDERRLVAKIKARFEEAARWGQPWKDQWLESFQSLNEQVSEELPFFSEVFPPETRRVTDQTAETIMGEVFGRDEGFLLKPMGGQSDLAREKFSRLMRFVYERRMGYKSLKYQQFKSCVGFGHGIQFHFTKPYHVRRMTRNVVPGPLPGMMATEHGFEDVVEFWPAGKIVSPFDFFEAPIGATIHEMPYCFVLERCLTDGLKHEGRQQGWRHVEELKGVALYEPQEGLAWTSDGVLTYSVADRLAAIGLGWREATGGSRSSGDRYSEKLWYIEAPAWGEGCGRVVLLSEWKVLEDWATCPWLHGEKPLSEIFFARKNDTDMWHADGLPVVIRQLQKKLTYRESLISDVIAETAFPMLLVNKDQLGDKVSLDWFDYAPERKIPITGDPRTVASPVSGTSRIPGEIWEDMALSQEAIQRLSQLFDASRRVAGGKVSGVGQGGKTARGLDLLMETAESAVTFKLLYAEETGIKKGLELDLANLQQVLTDEQVVEVTDPPAVLSGLLQNGGMPVGPEDVAGAWHIEPIGAGESRNSDERVRKKVAWAIQVAQTPAGALLDWVYLAKSTGRDLDISDLDKILPPDAEQRLAALKQVQQQLAMMKQQLELQEQGADVKLKQSKAFKDLVDAHAKAFEQVQRLLGERQQPDTGRVPAMTEAVAGGQ